MHIILESFLFQRFQDVSAMSAISEIFSFVLGALARELLRITLPLVWCRICGIISSFEESHFRVYFRVTFPTCNNAVKSNGIKYFQDLFSSFQCLQVKFKCKFMYSDEPSDAPSPSNSLCHYFLIDKVIYSLYSLHPRSFNFYPSHMA